MMGVARFGHRSIGQMLLLMALLVATAGVAHADDYSDAYDAFEAKDYHEAEKLFRGLSDQDPKDADAFHNLGVSLYRQKKFDEAKTAFGRAANLSEGKLKSRALFNKANAMVQLKQLKDAEKTYSEALSYDLENQKAKDNLSWLKKVMAEQKPQDNKQEQNQQSKDQQQQQQAQQQDASQDSSQPKDSQSNGQQSQSDPNKNMAQNNPSDQQPKEQDTRDQKDPNNQNKDEADPHSTQSAQQQPESKQDQNQKQNQQAQGGDDQKHDPDQLPKDQSAAADQTKDQNEAQAPSPSDNLKPKKSESSEARDASKDAGENPAISSDNPVPKSEEGQPLSPAMLKKQQAEKVLRSVDDKIGTYMFRPTEEQLRGRDQHEKDW